MDRFQADSSRTSASDRTHESTLDDELSDRTINMETGGPVENQPRPLVELEPDQTLGKYVIRRLLGQGAMGAVYLAFDPVIEREVAIKVLPREVGDNPLALSRFLTEARSTGKLNHPNVVSIFDIAECNGLHFIVMELLTGGTPGSETKKLHWLEATRIVAEAAAGLSAAHAKGLVHRDVKPDNLMLNGEGIVKVVDFGLSKLVDESNDTRDAVTKVGAILGTPQYMSPEQCEAKEVDNRSDIYSLGGTYFRLLTGLLPYEQFPSFMQVLMAHVNQPIPDPLAIDPDLPEPCRVIVSRAMAKDPEQRYQNASEFESDLRKLLAVNQSTVDFTPTYRKLKSVVIAEPSRMQSMIQRDLFEKSGVVGIRVRDSIATAQEALDSKSPDVLMTAMTFADGRGFDLLLGDRKANPISPMMHILSTSDFSLPDLVDLGLTEPLAVVSKKSKPADTLKAIHACSWLNMTQGALVEGSQEIDSTSVLIVCDSDRVPEPIAEQLRRLGLMNFEVATFEEVAAGGNANQFDLAILTRTAGSAKNDSSLYAGLLSRIDKQAQATAALQVDGQRVTLRALKYGGFSAITACEFDDERLGRIVRIIRN